ncbi:MAG TPA: ABC transporter permease [Sphingobium sp.]|nr:ABC transporter permease [Sphingobium sp.]
MSARGIMQEPRGGQIVAVMTRELRSRFVGDPLGYGWAYLTPLAWIAVIYAVFHILGRTSPVDADIGSFILSGIMPYLAFRYQVSSVLRAKTAYRSVMALPAMSPATIYAGIISLEFYNILIIYLALLLSNYMVFGALHLADPLAVFWGFLLASGVGGALGYALASLGSSGPSLTRATAIILRPMFYLSAVFYTANELPREWQAWLAWNPVLHAIELMRTGIFLDYDSDIATGWVPVVFILLCLGIGRWFGARSCVGAADEPATALD